MRLPVLSRGSPQVTGFKQSRQLCARTCKKLVREEIRSGARRGLRESASTLVDNETAPAQRRRSGHRTGVYLKLACTLVSALMTTVQVGMLPLQAPVQFTNWAVPVGVAVSVTEVFCGNFAEQLFRNR